MKALRRLALLVLGLMLAAGLGLIALPTTVDPLAYEPPAKPALTGVLAPNEALRQAHLLAFGRIHGPEDVAVDREGRVYCGTADGKIVRVRSDDSVEVFADTGGRPLGLRFDASGRLLVCDARKGLLAVDAEGRVTTLATEADGVPIRFADGLDVAADGRVFFSDASTKYGMGQDRLDILEARPHGRLLRYDPATQKATAALSDLYFANGVALSRDASFVLVSETARYRVTRLWLEGHKAGTTDVFVDNLPGFPDGISSNGEGTFWLTLFSVRNDDVDRVFHPRPWAKRLLAKLPDALLPKPQPYGLVLALDEYGRIVRSLHDPTGHHVRQITNAHEHAGALYFGTLEDAWIGRYTLPARAQ